MPLHNQLKELRESKSINQTEMANICGVSRQTVSSIERGDYHPSVVLALKLAVYFETSVEAIFQYEEEKI